jgi:hypothetical protein
MRNDRVIAVLLTGCAEQCCVGAGAAAPAVHRHEPHGESACWSRPAS